MARTRGRHRAPSTLDLGATGRAVARTVLAGAVVSAPLAVAAPANAASDATWDRVAQCESSGKWDINTGNSFYGGLQFTAQTWRGFGGAQFAPYAHQASRAQQIVVAERVLAGQGWGAWPVCSRKAGARGEAPTQRSTPTQRSAPAVQRSAPAPVAAPAPQRVRLSAPTTGSYVVKPGDTLSRIAATQRVAGGWKAIAQKNPALKNPNRIYPGQRLSI